MGCSLLFLAQLNLNGKQIIIKKWLFFAFYPPVLPFQNNYRGRLGILALNMFPDLGGAGVPSVCIHFSGFSRVFLAAEPQARSKHMHRGCLKKPPLLQGGEGC